jgi:hypothetical protein
MRDTEAIALNDGIGSTEIWNFQVAKDFYSSGGGYCVSSSSLGYLNYDATSN